MTTQDIYSAQRPRPLDGLGTALTVLLAANVVSGVAGVAVSLHRLDLLDRLRDDPWSVTDDEIDLSDGLLWSHYLFYLALMVATGVVFVIWLFRARRNLDRLGMGEEVSLGAGWAIGGWFIPLASFFLPFNLVNGVDKASRPPVPEPGGPELVRATTHPLVALWWLSWIVFLILNSAERSVSVDTLDQESTYMWLYLASSVVHAVAAVLAARVVRRITHHQRIRITAAWYGPVPAAPDAASI